MNRSSSLLIILSAMIIFSASKGMADKNESENKKSGTVIGSLKNIGVMKGNRAKSDKIHKKALALYKQKNFDEAEKLWAEAAKLDPSWWKPFFNMGCVAALSGKSDLAFDYLELAIERDQQRVIGYMRTDNDLKSLRGLEQYDKMMKRFFKPTATLRCGDGIQSVALEFIEKNTFEGEIMLDFKSDRGESYTFTHSMGDDEKLAAYGFQPGKYYDVCFEKTQQSSLRGDGHMDDIMVIFNAQLTRGQ